MQSFKAVISSLSKTESLCVEKKGGGCKKCIVSLRLQTLRLFLTLGICLRQRHFVAHFLQIELLLENMLHRFFYHIFLEGGIQFPEFQN